MGKAWTINGFRCQAKAQSLVLPEQSRPGGTGDTRGGSGAAIATAAHGLDSSLRTQLKITHFCHRHGLPTFIREQSYLGPQKASISSLGRRRFTTKTPLSTARPPRALRTPSLRLLTELPRVFPGTGNHTTAIRNLNPNTTNQGKQTHTHSPINA